MDPVVPQMAPSLSRPMALQTMRSSKWETGSSGSSGDEPAGEDATGSTNEDNGVVAKTTEKPGGSRIHPLRATVLTVSSAWTRLRAQWPDGSAR